MSVFNSKVDLASDQFKQYSDDMLDIKQDLLKEKPNGIKGDFILSAYLVAL